MSVLRVALHEPEMPANTGNIGRLCLAVGCTLEIVGQPGFRLDDRAVRRAGLDYWPQVDLVRHESLAALEASLDPSRLWVFSGKAERSYASARYAPGDVLLFGSESKGLPETFLQRHAARLLSLPMPGGKVRSLNLSSTVAVAVYEALRQIHGWGLEPAPPPADE